MDVSPKKRKNTKGKTSQEGDPDPTPRAETRLVSRHPAQQESPTRQSRRGRQQQHQVAEMGLDGTLEMDDLPDLRPTMPGYAESLQGSSDRPLAAPTSESSTTSKQSVGRSIQE